MVSEGAHDAAEPKSRFVKRQRDCVFDLAAAHGSGANLGCLSPIRHHQRKGKGCWVEGSAGRADGACTADDCAAGGGGLRRGKGTDWD